MSEMRDMVVYRFFTELTRFLSGKNIFLRFDWVRLGSMEVGGAHSGIGETGAQHRLVSPFIVFVFCESDRLRPFRQEVRRTIPLYIREAKKRFGPSGEAIFLLATGSHCYCRGCA